MVECKYGTYYAGYTDDIRKRIEAHNSGKGAKYLRGKGPVTFPFISRWRRATFSNLTGALVSGTPQPAPANTQFNPSTTAANLAAQQAASLQPLPPFPGRTQAVPLQLA